MTVKAGRHNSSIPEREVSDEGRQQKPGKHACQGIAACAVIGNGAEKLS